MNRRFSAKGAEALFGAAFTYAFTGVLVREVSSMWGDKAQVAVRWTLVFILLIIYGLFKNTEDKFPKEKLIHGVGLGISFTLVVLFFTAAIGKTTLANTLFTFYATNLIASFLFGTFILKENVSQTKLIAIALAIAGLSLYSKALVTGNLGIIFGVLAGVCAGVSNVQQKLLGSVNRDLVMRLQYGVGSAFSILVLFASRDEILRTFSWKDTILTAVFALVLILGSHLLLYGYKHFDVNVGTVIMSTELVFGAVLGLILFGEVPATHELLGGILIFAGSVVGSLNLGKGGNNKSQAAFAEPD